MNKAFESILLSFFKAESLGKIKLIQPLWSNYGELLRIELLGSATESVIVKAIDFHGAINHPRGWDSNLGHQRKVKSYEVETNWYANWAHLCGENCRVPTTYFIDTIDGVKNIVLEDLNQTGYHHRKSHLTLNEVKLGLSWLAELHATFMGQTPQDLWVIGSYWHLDTRPEEYNKMEAGVLKDIAKRVDDKLNNCTFKTIVHGDAKVANFCFGEDASAIAAVDFQYVGGGCGMKDVIYFLSSCLSELACERHESELLDYYFMALKSALNKHGNAPNFKALEKEWREMYVYAWVDFLRFLAGWAPDHYKVNDYSLSMLKRLGNV